MIRLTIAILLGIAAARPATSAEPEPEELTYEQHVRPIFRAHCFDCHGATAELKGSLDLRLVRFMRKGGKSGAAIEPGNAADSYLLNRVQNGEMPPGDARLSKQEIATLETWIAAGAKTARPEPESIGAGLGITPEERAYWAFQPIKRPTVPSFPAGANVRTPIDALLLGAMPDGLTFSPDADRLTLIKRAYFDLIGLPPTSEQLQKALNDSSSSWYGKLIDELLESPHYGERWGRHWLDVAGYADSEGYTVKDDVRPWAWKYRDYVIRSLNADKPFNQFILEQLAGDELMGPRTGDLTERQIELLTATGFLRMAADGTGSGANNPEARNQVMADTLKIVTTSLLGLSVACAQCHDHRYDPIPHTDYYALRAVFEPALNWQKWQTPQQRRISLYTAANRKQAAEVEAEAKKIADEKSAKQTKYMAEALEKELAKYKPPLRDQLKTAYKTPVKKRTPEHKALLKKHPSVNITPGVLYQYLPKAAEELKKFDKRIADVRKRNPVEEFLRPLVEQAGNIPETKLFHRGDHRQPKQVVTPAALTVVAPAGQRHTIAANATSRPTSGRREAFANWLTNGRHPLVARVLANRVWLHHFGRAIVSTPGDFGKLGTKPTHPKLLDWLADEFVRLDWSLKKLHRTIMLSTVYRQAWSYDKAKAAIDPENQFYWRKPIVRLEAETLRDRMLAASGQLDRKLFGAPLAIKENDAGQVVVDGGQKRRSLYIRVRRSQPVGMLQTFDAPVMETNCERRTNSTVATQSLMLMNGDFILSQARKLADRAAQEVPKLPDDVTAELAKIEPPPSPTSVWQFGYGGFDATKKRTASFTELPHWTGSSWQGGPKLPDPKLSFAIINANGGHTGAGDSLAAIRRWTAPAAGQLSILGSLHHPSENGDGVRGRVVSSRVGLAGEWTVHHGKVDSKVKNIPVHMGDTVDFITDRRGNISSDSFSWKVELTLTASGQPAKKWDSVTGFHGPRPSTESLFAQGTHAWQLALCHPPSDDDLRLLASFLAAQVRHLQDNPKQLPKDTTAATQALTNLCQTLLSVNEFLYVD